jgi:general secretion pathway protein G
MDHVMIFPRKRRRLLRRGEAGFTLVEMLVVITIIGLIMALVGPRVLNYLTESKVKAARIQIQSFASALDLFYLDAGRFPSSAEGLDALVRPAPGLAAWSDRICGAAACRTIHGARPMSTACPANTAHTT